MKKLYLSIIFLAAILPEPFAQTAGEPIENRKKYKAWVIKKDQIKIKGMGLCRVVDEQVVLAPIEYWEDIPYERLSKTVIPYSEIQSIRLRNKNHGWKGLLIGMGAGMIYGIISGAVEGDRYVEQLRHVCGGLFSNPCPPNVPYPGIVFTREKVLVKKAEALALERGLGYGMLGGILGYIAGSGIRIKIGFSNKEKSLEELTRYSYFRE